MDTIKERSLSLSGGSVMLQKGREWVDGKESEREEEGEKRV